MKDHVIEFSTSFENKASGTETVTPVMDRDGIWRDPAILSNNLPAVSYLPARASSRGGTLYFRLEGNRVRVSGV